MKPKHRIVVILISEIRLNDGVCLCVRDPRVYQYPGARREREDGKIKPNHHRIQKAGDKATASPSKLATKGSTTVTGSLHGVNETPQNN
jgi:hypothetical protein